MHSKESNTGFTRIKNEKPPDPILELIKAWWNIWLPGFVNLEAKKPHEVFPLLNQPWRWWRL